MLASFAKFLLFFFFVKQIAFCNMIVSLPKSHTRHPARARAPLPLAQKLFDVTNFSTILPLLPIVIAKSCKNTSGISSRHVALVWRLGDLVSREKNCEQGGGFFKVLCVRKHVWEMEGSTSAR